MRILFVLLIHVFLFQWTSAQSNIDSLEQILPDSKGNMQIQILIELADASYTTSPTKLLEYSSKAYQLSSAEDEQELMAESLRIIGSSHFYTYDFIAATNYLKKSLWIYTDFGNEIMKAKISQSIGLAYLQANEYDSLGVYLSWAAELHTTLCNLKGNIDGMALANLNLGNVYLEQENLIKAEALINKSKSLAKEIHYGYFNWLG